MLCCYWVLHNIKPNLQVLQLPTMAVHELSLFLWTGKQAVEQAVQGSIGL